MVVSTHTWFFFMFVFSNCWQYNMKKGGSSSSNNNNNNNSGLNHDTNGPGGISSQTWEALTTPMGKHMYWYVCWYLNEVGRGWVLTVGVDCGC